MRRWALAAVVAATAQGAWAADLPEDFPALRGGITDGLTRTSVYWQGAYVGGQLSYSSANMDFSNATQSLTSFMFQNLALQGTVSGWTLLGRTSPVSAGFGGFVGYNAQWDDAVLGIEGNYTRLSNLTGSQGNTLPMIATPTNTCFVPPPGDTVQCGAQLSGAATATISDVVTLRGRAGYAIGNFLPYMFGGVALALADVSRTATVNTQSTFFNATTKIQDGAPITDTHSTTQTSHGLFTYGWTAGAGFETMLWGGLFTRAEYEYIRFVSLKNINVQMNTVRLGLGYKF